MSDYNFDEVKIIHFNRKKGGMHEYAQLLKAGYFSNGINASIESCFFEKSSYLGLFLKILFTKKNEVWEWFNKIEIKKNTLIHFSDISIFIYPLIFGLLSKLNNSIIMTLHDPIPHGERQIQKKLRNKIIYWLNKIICYWSYKYEKLHIHIHSEAQKITRKGSYIVAKHPIANNSLEYTKVTKCPSDEKVKFLFIGRLEYYKGIDLYVKAANKALSSFHKECLSFTLAGRGELNPELNYENLEVINEFIEEKKFDWLIESAHVIVLPYINATQSGVLNRAIEFNKPVIISEAGELPNYVINNKTGLIISDLSISSLVKSFSLFINNKEMITQFSANSYEIKEKLTSRKIVESILDQLLKKL